jgi:hypothetical protein
MLAGHSSSRALFESLPDKALLRIFQLLCDSCPPQTPGTCGVAPVCKQWQELSCSVKGLRVLFQSKQQQQVDSFCAWLRRHAPQIKALAVTGNEVVPVLRVLAARGTSTSSSSSPATKGVAIAAQAAGHPLPLERLVLPYKDKVDSEVCYGTLGPLLGALPNLKHLHLPLRLEDEPAWAAAVSAADRLRHSTSLTSLVLDGPWCHDPGNMPAWVHPALLADLPPSLCSLIWNCGTPLTLVIVRMST